MPRNLINIIVLFLIIVLGLAVIANSMTKPLGHDEHMYCTAGALLSEGKMIYRDFSYVAQLPYHPLLCAALFRMFNTTRYLLVGRAFSALCDIGIIICIMGIYRRVLAGFDISGKFLGLAAVILYVFNPFVDYASGFAWNHDLVLLCVLVSFWLFITTDFSLKSRYRRVAVIAGLLTVASGSRITTVLVQLLFFAMLFLQPSIPFKQRCKTALSFLLATAVVSIWPVWTILAAPRAFWLNLVRIPVLNGRWLREMGLYYYKTYLTVTWLTTTGCFVLLLIGVLLFVMVLLGRRKPGLSGIVNYIFAVLLVVVFFVIAYIPATMWHQYLAIPVPFILISFAFPLRQLRQETSSKPGPNRRFKIACALVTACAFVAVWCYPVVSFRIPQFFNRQSWVPLRVHEVAQNIAQNTTEPKLVLTLAPLFAVEGGCEIYPEFSAGPFVYRIADSLLESERKICHAIRPKDLKQLLDKSPPSAVVVGTEPSALEQPIIDTSLKLGAGRWKSEKYPNGPTAYFMR